jgi:hypothetical protein
VARQQQFVLCPFCGDPVPGPFPRPGELIHCTYCQQMFAFDGRAVKAAFIEYRAPEARWKVVALQTEMHAQATRILDFCTRAAPGCMVQVTPVGPDSFQLRVTDEGSVLVAAEQNLLTHELASKSDEQLWELLESISQQGIKRVPD